MDAFASQAGHVLLAPADRLHMEDEGRRALCAGCTCYALAFASDLLSLAVLRMYEPKKYYCDMETWWPWYSLCYPCIFVRNTCAGMVGYDAPPAWRVNTLPEQRRKERAQEEDSQNPYIPISPALGLVHCMGRS